MSKCATLLLIIVLTLSSLIIVESAFAQSIPKPSVPEFSVKLLDSSYDEPTTHSTNPYTGEKVTHPGYRVESRTIEIKIKNQPFTPFLVEEATANWTAYLQYNIRWKGHFEQDWHEIYIPTNGFAGANLESDYTAISFEGEYSSSEGLNLYYQGLIATFPSGAQVDFQVKAMIGYVHRDPSLLGWIFTGETSGWSETRTITIPASTASPTDSQTPDQTTEPTTNGDSQTLQSAAIIGTVVAIVLVSAVLLIYFKKRNRQTQLSAQQQLRNTMQKPIEGYQTRDLEAIP